LHTGGFFEFSGCSGIVVTTHLKRKQGKLLLLSKPLTTTGDANRLISISTTRRDKHERYTEG
ncbi:hypothetical protein ACFLUL_01310, partial [Chloroflexota bacterium]